MLAKDTAHLLDGWSQALARTGPPQGNSRVRVPDARAVTGPGSVLAFNFILPVFDRDDGVSLTPRRNGNICQREEDGIS